MKNGTILITAGALLLGVGVYLFRDSIFSKKTTEKEVEGSDIKTSNSNGSFPLTLGSKGGNVKALQEMVNVYLSKRNSSERLDTDGILGARTQSVLLQCGISLPIKQADYISLVKIIQK